MMVSRKDYEGKKMDVKNCLDKKRKWVSFYPTHTHISQTLLHHKTPGLFAPALEVFIDRNKNIYRILTSYSTSRIQSCSLVSTIKSIDEYGSKNIKPTNGTNIRRFFLVVRKK